MFTHYFTWISVHFHQKLWNLLRRILNVLYTLFVQWDLFNNWEYGLTFYNKPTVKWDKNEEIIRWEIEGVCEHVCTCTNLQLLDNPLYITVCHRNTNRLSDSHRVPEAQLASYQIPGSETNIQHTDYPILKSKTNNPIIIQRLKYLLPLGPTLSQTNPVYTLTPYFFVSINISSRFMNKSLK